MHPLPDFSGCVRTRRTRSNGGPDHSSEEITTGSSVLEAPVREKQGFSNLSQEIGAWQSKTFFLAKQSQEVLKRR